MKNIKAVIVTTASALALLSMGSTKPETTKLTNTEQKVMIAEAKLMRQSHDALKEFDQNVKDSHVRIAKNNIDDKLAQATKPRVEKIAAQRHALEVKKQAEVNRQNKEKEQARKQQDAISARQNTQPYAQSQPNTTNYGSDLKNYVLSRMVAATNVPASQWDYIITRESRWMPTAQNPYSTAHGLFQSLWINGNNDVDYQINDAIRLFKADVAAGGNGLRPWALY